MAKENTKKEEAFLAVTDKRELSEVLSVPYKVLIYNLYKIPPEKKYTVFEIVKKNGKIRKICAPVCGIKFIQRNLASILQEIYKPKNCVHGFVKNKGIKTNARTHIHKKILINLDIEDFFPSINFGHVRGLFLSRPFNFPDNIATVLAQICCHEGILPQGAPTSPVISNFICYKLDNRLLHLARTHKMYYTRYADDITFSTNLQELPSALGIIEDKALRIADRTTAILLENGFEPNPRKTRFAYGNNRQEVTGLTVNSGLNVNRKYIRQIRSMLHAWEKFGSQAAARQHFERMEPAAENAGTERKFLNRLTGKIGYIGYIKGKTDPVYLRLAVRLKNLAPAVSLAIPANLPAPALPIVFCEGKTDGLHLQAALEWFRRKNEFTDLDLYFFRHLPEHKINNEELLKACETASWNTFNDTVRIYLFDRDVTRINKAADQGEKDYKSWGNKVYSVLLPLPPHREANEICIEMYYNNEDLLKTDENGRRLYLSTEFNPETGSHLSENLLYPRKNYLKGKFPRIIDSQVYDKDTGDNMALSKNDFARRVIQKKGSCRDISFENFRPLFRILSEIVCLPEATP